MRVRPIYGSGGQYVKLEPTDSSHRIGPQPASDGWVCGRAALYPAESIEKSIGYPIVAEASKLHPLPMNRRVGDRASCEKRLSGRGRNRCRPLRSPL